MFFDTHAHYDDEKFDGDREELLASLPAKGVGRVVDCASDPEGARRVLRLAERYPYIYAAVGIHPEEAEGRTEADVAEIAKLAKRDRVVAVGEIGLDYHYEDGADRETQKRLLRAQLALARELDLPVVIHDRDAHEDSLAAAREFRGIRGVFHCYSGSWETAKEILDHGWYLSFTGVVTFKNARRALEVVRNMPLERLMIETDSPYLAPEPRRGRRNDSRNLVYTAARIAQERGMEAEELARAAYTNGLRFFGIKPQNT